MNIIPFESSNLPAYLKNVDVSEINGDLLAHAGGGFPVISIKGKVFAVVRDGERNVIPNPKDPESPATSVEMVIIKANKNVSKVWYASGYQEGSEAKKPDCFSQDGVKPDPTVENPCAKSCALCPKNQWASKINEHGVASKGKACQDSVRIAVATPDQINDPYMIRVPPASIRALGEHGQFLKKKGVAYNMVVTKIGFDMDSPTPKLTFKPVGFISDNAYAEVREMASSDVVQNILGSVFVEHAVTADAPAVEEAEKAVAKAAAKPAAAPKVATKAKVVEEAEVVAAVAEAEKPAPKAEVKTVTNLDDFDLSEINFDD